MSASLQPHGLSGCRCEPCAMLGFVTSGGEDFDQGPETRLNMSFLCNRILLKYKGDRENF